MEKVPDTIEIKPLGSYLEIDNEGYVINPTSLEKIQEEWKPVVTDITELYKRQFGDTLVNVYIRGSVAKGDAVQGIADIDAFAYVKLSTDEIKKYSIKSEKEVLLSKYKFIPTAELYVTPIEDRTKRLEVIFLNQSVCVYGDPINAPKLRPGKDMMIHLPNIYNRMEWMQDFMKKDQSPQEIQGDCVWVMKGLLRSGCELVMERSKKYTRDLYPCYQVFSEYYPEKEQEMREVLHLALNPTPDKAKIEEIMNNLAVWLQEEYKKHYE